MVSRPKNLETTSLGAALAAGITVGFYDKQTLFQTEETTTTNLSPSIDAKQADARYRKWKKAVTKSLELSDLTA